MEEDPGRASIDPVRARSGVGRWIGGTPVERRPASDCSGCSPLKKPEARKSYCEKEVAVTFLVPGVLREFTGGLSQVEIEGSAQTVQEALTVLWRLYPGLRDRIVNEQEHVRHHINIFVGDEDIRYTGGLATAVNQRSVISIIPAVSGGAAASNRP